MGLFDKLKTLINIDIKDVTLININVNKNSHNVDENKILQINPQLLNPQEKGKLKDILQEYVSSGEKLLETKSLALLYRLYEYDEENTNKELLGFFKKIIPANDYLALEASLFLREEFNNGANVSVLKTDIRNRFGDRGGTICNLCTANYFETFFMPLREKDPDRFDELYELTVGQESLTLFVHERMNARKIPGMIYAKLEKSIKYGIESVHIHAIGKKNIEIINKSINEQKDFYNQVDIETYRSSKAQIEIKELIRKGGSPIF